MLKEIPKNVIESAQISASAWEIPWYVVVTQESQQTGCGGEYRTAKRGNEWRAWDGKPTTPLLAVLP